MTALPGRAPRPALRTAPPPARRGGLPVRAVLLLLVALAGLLAVGAAVRALLHPLSGVDGTFGAWLVTAATPLLLGASLLVGLAGVRGGLRGLLVALIALGVLGTAAAAWLMMQWTLLGATAALGVLGLFWLAAPSRA